MQIYESCQANIVGSESNLCLLDAGADFLLLGDAYSLLGILISFALIPLIAIVDVEALALAEKWRRMGLNKITEKINQECNRDGRQLIILHMK